MPQLRSFSSFGPSLNLGAAYSSGVEEAQKAIQAKDQIQLGQQKIAADMTQANMELQAKSQALQMQNMRQQQEMEMEKAYKEQMLGLKSRELQQADAMIDLKVQEAARSFDATQRYQQEAADMIASGVPEQQAYMQSALKHGPQMHLPGSVYTQAFKPAKGDAGLGEATDIPGLPNDQFKRVQTGPESFQVVRLPPNMAGDEGAPEGYTRFGNRVLRKVDPPEVVDLKKERDRLTKAQDADGFGRDYSDKEAAGQSVPKSAKGMIERYRNRASEIRAIQDKIAKYRAGTEKTGGQKAPEGAKEGQKVRNKKTGKMGTVQGGYIVPDEEDDSEE